jgi:hypothetical protein
LHAGGGVHDVTVCKAQSDIGLGPGVHDRLSGVHHGPNGEVQLGMLAVQLLDGLEDSQSRANRSLGIVAMGGRRPNSAMTASPMNFSTILPND